MVLAADGHSAATGKTVAITISKAGAAFGNPAAGATNATEISSGVYKVALGTGDTDTEGDLTIRGTAALCDDLLEVCQVAAPVKLADVVAHGGTPGSSTATIAAAQINATNTNGHALVLSASGAGNAVDIYSDEFAGINIVSALNGILINADGGYDIALQGSGDIRDVVNNVPVGVMLADVDHGGSTARIIVKQISITNEDDHAIIISTAGTNKNGIDITTTAGHGVSIAAAGAGKHDINLGGSGDIVAKLAANALDNIVIETGCNARQALSLITSALAGILSGAATTTVTIKGAGVATTRIVATVDASGNRSALTLTPPA